MNKLERFKLSKIMLWTIFFMGIAIATPMDYFPFNKYVSHLLPSAMAIMACIFPFFMSLTLKLEYEYLNQQERYKHFLEKAKLKQLLFSSSFRSLRDRQHGTEWLVANTGEKPWKTAVFFIEQNLRGGKLVEKHYIHNVRQGKSIKITSKLQDVPGTSWRTMILTEQTYKIGLAARWKNQIGWKFFKSSNSNRHAA